MGAADVTACADIACGTDAVAPDGLDDDGLIGLFCTIGGGANPRGGGIGL